MAMLALNRVSSWSKKLRKEPKATVPSLNFPHASKVMVRRCFAMDIVSDNSYLYYLACHSCSRLLRGWLEKEKVAPP